MVANAHKPVMLSLDGAWRVTPLPLEVAAESGWRALADHDDGLEALVPGEIHLDLMRAGRIADPNVGANARAARWPEEHSWWYRTAFTPPPGFGEHHRQRLVFEGLDLCAQVFLNGELVGESENAFAPLVIDVRDRVVAGENDLVVRLTSGMELLPPLPENEATDQTRVASISDPIHYNRSFVIEKYRFLRKSAYMTYGWDWCDPLPNIGIWKGVRLEGHSDVALASVRLDTAIEGATVALVGDIALENLHVWRELPVTIEVRVEPPFDDPSNGDGAPIVHRVQVPAPAGLSWVPIRIEIPEPRLWWPNGIGAQPLYRLVASVSTAGGETDRCEQRIGLRTIELDRSPIGHGSRFGFRVNGELVFASGANIAPLDLIPARLTPDRYRALVAQAKDAHFTMLRVNGVGIYETDAFYEACDEAGILVWQDFTFSCAIYPARDPEFAAKARAEAVANVHRLRHHASLALWCGNNEVPLIEPDPGTDPGQTLYTYLLAEVCRTLDPVRPYWPGTPYGGDDPDGDEEGTQHGWGAGGFGGWRDVLDTLPGKFYAEYYMPHSTPHLDSVREYTGMADPVRGSDEWRIHTNTFIERGIDGQFSPRTTIPEVYGAERDSLTLEDEILYGQLAQAQAHGAALEALRFRKGDPDRDCEGALMWSFNDTWGETGWSVVDAYDRRKAAYYWVKRAARPVKVLVRSRGGKLVVRVINDTLASHVVVVSAGWMRLDGTASELREHRVDVPPNSNVFVTDAPLPGAAERDPADWLYAAILRGEDVPEDQAAWLLAPHRDLRLSAPTVSVSVRESAVELESPVYAHAVHVEDGGRPLLDDNFIELLPGIAQTIGVVGKPVGEDLAARAVLPPSGQVERTS